jgi:hypothetical protein
MWDKSEYSVLKIRKRAWYVWLWRVAWFMWLVVWAEVARGSLMEFEQKAFKISWIIFLVSLGLGLLLWLWGSIKFKKKQSIQVSPGQVSPGPPVDRPLPPSSDNSFS